MSFKAIDLQFAVHKNDEAGIKQNQLMQKPRQDGTILENQATLTTERDRGRASKLEESGRADIKDRREQKKTQIGKSKTRGQLNNLSTESEQHPDHPYKGHHIDFSL
ncbi:hypothetical protein ASG89_13665 [Paenibacillus sp. Soil766]|uniref:hypothetical protein n=1 Tax=Paenibacillus sp. Soil766 TaxID=1736404 RepID=UPI00071087C8|nr:hypothetical protein [Paenibacillus sp. Soil766]KRE83162.1 hypothetical protein ASG89_13665 [Paenibacillus sp. Soil766]